MDPNEVLKRLREQVGQWHLANTEAHALHAAQQVVNLFTDLDEWLNKGGFLPADWGRGS